MNIPSAKPFFSDQDIQAISEDIRLILSGGRLILGPYTRRLENSFCEYIGVKYAAGVSSCTAALEICLRYFDIVGKEVIVPTNTFIASSNAVLFAGGQPVLADIKPETLCIDPADFQQKITSRTRGVIVVHIAGLPCPDIYEIKNVCRDKGLFLLEDVAHAHGATINGEKTGSIGDAGCYSFYPTKVMTTCTGGMITTNDERLSEYAVSLRHFGVGRGLHHIVNLGSDWLMDEISAVLGIYQLKGLEHNLAKRNDIARRYADSLADSEWVDLFPVPSDIRHSYYKYPIMLSPSVDKEELTGKMQTEYGIELGSIYDPPCHRQPVYQRLFNFREGMFPNADATLKRTCCLPVFPQMTAEEVSYVIQSLKSSLPSTLVKPIAVEA